MLRFQTLEVQLALHIEDSQYSRRRSTLGNFENLQSREVAE